MRKVFLFLLFCVFTPLTLSISIFSLWQIIKMKSNSTPVEKWRGEILSAQAPIELYSSIPPSMGTISQSFGTGDARPVLIKNYLEKYNSPLLPYSDYIFQVSQEFNLDYGLIVAIAQCESNVCKKIPPGSYNCWGFENGETKFNSWEHALRRVAQTLKEGYYDHGLVTPEQIMPKYAPPSVEKGGPWAKCVDKFLSELR